MAIVKSGVSSRVFEDTLAVRLADADSIAPANDSIVNLSVHDLSDF